MPTKLKSFREMFVENSSMNTKDMDNTKLADATKKSFASAYNNLESLNTYLRWLGFSNHYKTMNEVEKVEKELDAFYKEIKSSLQLVKKDYKKY